MIKWYINRLASMSVPELFYRIKQKLQAIYESKFRVGYKPTHIKCTVNKSSFLFSTEIEKTFDNTVDIFNLRFDYFEKINWSLDIQSGNEFPLHFSKNIDIRTNKYGNAKVVWEINRMTFLPGLCLNYISTKEEMYLRKFTGIITSWEAQNPYLKGINWYSNIEISIRLINWFFCWCILDVNHLQKKDPRFHNFVQNTWLPLIYLHCKYSSANPSLFSSANNHLIAEHAGLFIASCLWKFPGSEKWLSMSQKGLEKEIVKQHSKNGINREQAAEYIQFITDFFLLSYVIGKKANVNFSDEYEKYLFKIFDYINEFLAFDGKFPNYGDEDDGLLIDFGINNSSNFRSLLTSGAILYKEGRFINHSNGFDLKNNILFGAQGEKTYKSLENKPNYHSKHYKDEGLFFIKKKESAERNIYFYFDAAPLGFLSIAAHGHADALSFLLNVDNKPVFIDSGTYTYHNAPKWREYFMGTLAHNTARVNKKDQATIGGSTLWLNHYKCRVMNTEKNDTVELIKASHDGYKGMGVIHTREIAFYRSENRFIITDAFDLLKDSDFYFEIPFHIHPDISVIEVHEENKYFLSCNDMRSVEILLPGECKKQLCYGREEPVLGWYSESFQNKKPCYAIHNTVVARESFKLTTQIKIEDI